MKRIGMVTLCFLLLAGCLIAQKEKTTTLSGTVTCETSAASALQSSLSSCALVPATVLGINDWHDTDIGAKRIAAIKGRLSKATPCPWKSDGTIDGWWSGEQPGVMVRSAANLQMYAEDSGTTGGPVAEVSSAYWSGSHNPIADANFIAHSCEDISFLLAELDRKSSHANSGAKATE